MCDGERADLIYHAIDPSFLPSSTATAGVEPYPAAVRGAAVGLPRGAVPEVLLAGEGTAGAAEAAGIGGESDRIRQGVAGWLSVALPSCCLLMGQDQWMDRWLDGCYLTT